MFIIYTFFLYMGGVEGVKAIMNLPKIKYYEWIADKTAK